MFGFLVLCGTIAWHLLSTPASSSGTAELLRTRGLIVEDGQGRPRVLLGAPAPSIDENSSGRSTTTGLVFLDERGRTRLRVGGQPRMKPSDPGGSDRVWDAVHALREKRALPPAGGKPTLLDNTLGWGGSTEIDSADMTRSPGSRSCSESDGAESYGIF